MNDASGEDAYAVECDRYKRLCGLLHDALAFYANPETYHAIVVLADPPAGEFADDFSADHGHDFYERAMPGRLARETLKKAADEFGDMQMYTQEAE